MVEYSATHYAQYSLDTGELIGAQQTINSDGSPLTLYDIDGDGVWSDGETLQFTGYSGTDYSYLGTVDVNGVICPIVGFSVASGMVGLLMLPDAETAAFAPSSISAPNGADFVPCFGAGTLIDTPQGPRAVETLAIGDKILAAGGDVVPVKWIGRHTIFAVFKPAERLAPVRIAAGALGDGLPKQDLVLTSDHALLLDGVLVQAGALVNGTTIRKMAWTECDARFTVYHVETEDHAVILANGCPAETFVDNVGRRAFDNFAEYAGLYGEETPVAELTYPRAISARQVPERIRARLGVRQVA